MKPSLAVILLNVIGISIALADDFETKGERAAVMRQAGSLGLQGWYPLRPVKKSEAASQESAVTLVKRVEALNQKLDVIRIPKIDFQDVPLLDAAHWLRDAARQSDFKGSEMDKGVNIVVKFSGKEPAICPLVTLHLTNVTLREALVQLCAPFKIRMEILPYAVELRRP